MANALLMGAEAVAAEKLPLRLRLPRSTASCFRGRGSTPSSSRSSMGRGCTCKRGGSLTALAASLEGAEPSTTCTGDGIRGVETSSLLTGKVGTSPIIPAETRKLLDEDEEDEDEDEDDEAV